MATKTQIKIMKLFVSHITERFSINGIAKELDMNVSLAHRVIKSLIGSYLIKDKQQYLSLNYHSNHGFLAYIEFLRREEFLKKHRTIAAFQEEILEKLKDDPFIMILFGSTVEKKNPRDYDVLFIFETYDKVKRREKTVDVIASHHSDKFDINVLAIESMYEMAAKRTQKNVLNELLNKHIILHGSEYFYKMLHNARQ
jgi:predicted nucleotidyltransferase